MQYFQKCLVMGMNISFIGYKREQTEIYEDKIKKWQDKAIDKNSDYIRKFRNTAKELKMAIAVTYLEKHEPQPRNTVSIIDEKGEIILDYSKVHTVDFKMEAFTDYGTDFNVCELKYGKQSVKIGTMICYDRDFPESARILMLKGAEIILVPNACNMRNIILHEQRVRAYENMVGMVTVNYPNERNKGKSSAYSPITKDEYGNEVDNELLVMGEDEEIQIVSFDMESIRKYRETQYLGDAFRKPFAYGDLILNHPISPFVRNEARR